MKHTSYEIHHTTYDIQHKTYDKLLTIYDIQHMAHNKCIRYTTYDMRHTTYMGYTAKINPMLMISDILRRYHYTTSLIMAWRTLRHLWSRYIDQCGMARNSIFYLHRNSSSCKGYDVINTYFKVNIIPDLYK